MGFMVKFHARTRRANLGPATGLGPAHPDRFRYEYRKTFGYPTAGLVSILPAVDLKMRTEHLLLLMALLPSVPQEHNSYVASNQNWALPSDVTSQLLAVRSPPSIEVFGQEFKSFGRKLLFHFSQLL
jgi:hypothetical protein